MIGFVITGHGAYAQGMLESVELIAGVQENTEVVPFENDKEELEERLRRAVSEVDQGDGVICFADLAGGTPFNVSSLLASSRDDLEVVGGTNIPMILSGAFQRTMPLENFTDAILKEGAANIKQFTKSKRNGAKDSSGI